MHRTNTIHAVNIAKRSDVLLGHAVKISLARRRKFFRSTIARGVVGGAYKVTGRERKT